MDTIKNAGNQVADSAKGMTDTVSKEGNKEQAKDSSKPISERAGAATDAAGDKAKETKHSN